MTPVISLTPASAPNADDDLFLAAVGALLRARTTERGTAGNELGTFTPNTRPTGDEVLMLRTSADQDISVETGDLTDLVVTDEIAAKLTVQYGSLLALRTAMLVELSYFPEQVATGRSAYAQYEKMYDKRLASFVTAIEQAGTGDEPGAVDDAVMPVFSFPPAPCDPGEIPVSPCDPRRWYPSSWGC
jgi:hypothetical protein